MLRYLSFSFFARGLALLLALLMLGSLSVEANSPRRHHYRPPPKPSPPPRPPSHMHHVRPPVQRPPVRPPALQIQRGLQKQQLDMRRAQRARAAAAPALAGAAAAAALDDRVGAWGDFQDLSESELAAIFAPIFEGSGAGMEADALKTIVAQMRAQGAPDSAIATMQAMVGAQAGAVGGATADLPNVMAQAFKAAYANTCMCDAQAFATALGAAETVAANTFTERLKKTFGPALAAVLPDIAGQGQGAGGQTMTLQTGTVTVSYDVNDPEVLLARSMVENGYGADKSGGGSPDGRDGGGAGNKVALLPKEDPPGTPPPGSERTPAGDGGGTPPPPPAVLPEESVDPTPPTVPPADPRVEPSPPVDPGPTADPGPAGNPVVLPPAGNEGGGIIVAGTPPGTDPSPSPPPLSTLVGDPPADPGGNRPPAPPADPDRGTPDPEMLDRLLTLELEPERPGGNDPGGRDPGGDVPGGTGQDGDRPGTTPLDPLPANESDPGTSNPGTSDPGSPTAQVDTASQDGSRPTDNTAADQTMPDDEANSRTQFVELVEQDIDNRLFGNEGSLEGNPEDAGRYQPYGVLSEAIYDNREVEGFTPLTGPIENPNTGFKGRVLQNDETKEIVVVFQGTNVTSWNDWVNANLAQGAGYLPDQYVQASKLVNVAKNYNDRNGLGYKVVAVGHSLGGGLANYGAVMNDTHAVTINPASTGDALAEDMRIKLLQNPEQKPNGKIVNVRVAGDQVSGLATDFTGMKNPGTTLTMDRSTTTVVGAHFVGNANTELSRVSGTEGPKMTPGQHTPRTTVSTTGTTGGPKADAIPSGGHLGKVEHTTIPKVYNYK